MAKLPRNQTERKVLSVGGDNANGKYIDFQKSVFYLLKSKKWIFACEKMHVSFCHNSTSSNLQHYQCLLPSGQASTTFQELPPDSDAPWLHPQPTGNVAQILINLTVLLLPPTIQETQSVLLWPGRHHQECCCARLTVLQEHKSFR